MSIVHVSCGAEGPAEYFLPASWEDLHNPAFSAVCGKAEQYRLPTLHVTAQIVTSAANQRKRQNPCIQSPAGAYSGIHPVTTQTVPASAPQPHQTASTPARHRAHTILDHTLCPL